MFEGHRIWYLFAALLISGTLAASISYWAANAYIAHSHTGDPLQTQGELKPSQGSQK
jgi:hypothetical protein